MVWYGKAAKQGDADAQFGLGLMYANGHGVSMFNIAAAGAGAPDASVRDSVKWRDLVATRMTAAQIAEAQRLAQEWRPMTPSP